VASKSAVQTEAEKAEVIEDALNDLEKEIDRLKSMYEQYFLGIQKTAPAFIHNEVDRKLRELTQANIRQTRLRYKFVTLNQKFGSYNAYWRRTLREIESGKYIRNLQKIGREAVRSGDEIPQEILNAMPKRMREQVVRDREAAIAQAKRRGKLPGNEFAGEDSTQEDAEILAFDAAADDDFAAVIKEPSELRRNLKPAPNRPHQLTKEDADFDLDAFFKQVENDEEHTNVKGGIPQPAPSATRISPAPPQPARITQPITSPKVRPSEPMLAQPPVRPSEPAPARPPVRPSEPVLAPPPPAPPGVARIRPSVAMAAQKPPDATTPVIPNKHAQTMPGFQPAKAGLQTMPGVQPAKPAVPRPQPLVQPPPPPLTTQPPPVQVQTAPLPRVPSVPGIARIAASQATKPLPVQPGATDARPTPVVESVSSGQFKRPPPAPALKPPPGMSDADVNALHANYIKAKQMVGEDPGAGSRDKLLRTINAQAPKIMDQYKVGSVDFSVIVKDNQVIIRAKPKGKP
jgi:hypothetical protein